MHTHVYIYICIYREREIIHIYIYIYMERERERERESMNQVRALLSIKQPVFEDITEHQWFISCTGSCLVRW